MIPRQDASTCFRKYKDIITRWIAKVVPVPHESLPGQCQTSYPIPYDKYASAQWDWQSS
ncbi:MAG: hypothetical protein LZF86_190327 [Nitrospira sp.]|nr:MAG: hypothetical protein LZF86_190327 [Nitrospira sp.]